MYIIDIKHSSWSEDTQLVYDPWIHEVHRCLDLMDDFQYRVVFNRSLNICSGVTEK